MAGPAEPTPRVNILIADDDAQARWELRRLLEHRGYTCAEAADGLRALGLARAAPPRCLLLDLALPGLDGFGVARRLRVDPRTRGIHIHCLTGLGDPGARVRARLTGCEEFLTKPVDPARLLDLVRRHVEPPPVGWLAGLSLAEARDALASLEREGCDGLALSCQGRSFSVRCACPPGLRLGRDGRGRVRLLPW